MGNIKKKIEISEKPVWRKFYKFLGELRVLGWIVDKGILVKDFRRHTYPGYNELYIKMFRDTQGHCASCVYNAFSNLFVVNIWDATNKNSTVWNKITIFSLNSVLIAMTLYNNS